MFRRRFRKSFGRRRGFRSRIRLHRRRRSFRRRVRGRKIGYRM